MIQDSRKEYTDGNSVDSGGRPKVKNSRAYLETQTYESEEKANDKDPNSDDNHSLPRNSPNDMRPEQIELFLDGHTP